MFGFGGATGQSYPAGANPWSGNPLQVSPNYTYFTPAQVPAAEELNFILASMTAATAAGIAVPGTSWRATAPVSTTGLTAFTGGKWVQSINAFLLCASASAGTGNCDVFLSRGVDSDYATDVANGSAITLGGILTDAWYDGTHYFATVIKHSDGSLNVYRCSPGGAWGLVLNDASFIYNNAVVGQIASTVYVIASTLSGTSVLAAWYATAGAGGSAQWTGFSGILQAANDVYVASSGALLVAMPQNSPPTNYMTSPDGQTWTQRSAAFLTHGDTPGGIAWSAADQLFVLVTQGADVKMHTYTSPDGLTWTETATPVQAFGGQCHGLGCTAQGCLVTQLQDGGGDHLVYSIDAGATWRWAMPLLALPGFTALTSPRMATSAVGFWAMNSGTSRFSHASGYGNALA